jgi:hypothetical protein
MVNLAVGLGCRNPLLASPTAALPALLPHHLQNLGAFKIGPSIHPSAASSIAVGFHYPTALEIRDPFSYVLSPGLSGQIYP